MHRVELKATTSGDGECHQFHVPNAPCGVESAILLRSFSFSHSATFLMHRVELKDLLCLGCLEPLLYVPNAPCGVESRMKNNMNLIILKCS